MAKPSKTRTGNLNIGLTAQMEVMIVESIELGLASTKGDAIRFLMLAGRQALDEKFHELEVLRIASDFSFEEVCSMEREGKLTPDQACKVKVKQILLERDARRAAQA